MKQEEFKQQYKTEYHKDITITGISAKVDNQELERLEFESEEFEVITYKPRKLVIKTSIVNGLKTKEENKERYKLTEFRDNNPLIEMLIKNLDKESQTLTVTFTKMNRFDTEDAEEVWHNFFNERQFNMIAYEKYGKKDYTEKLADQMLYEEKAQKKQQLK